ncbi:hypothetical protein MR060_11610 [bacterium]|nr:hypothetical protein [bacterium]
MVDRTAKTKKIIFSSETQITGQQNKGRNKKRGRMFADFSTSGCEIQQWIKNCSEKDRTPSNHYVVGPAKSPLHHDMKAPGKMWRHNPTGYISPGDAAKNFFNLAGLQRIC